VREPSGETPPFEEGSRGGRPRILFIAEAVTLAHVARPLALAGGLDPARYRVVFASEPRFGEPWRARGFEYRPIRSIPPEQFLAALAAGRPVYDPKTLESYLAEDLALISQVEPDVVVGDFRLTLSVSARLAQVPYLTIANAYWSPFADPTYPMPEFPLSRFLGVRLATPLFHLAQPMAFAMHTRPLDRLRKAHGLAGLGDDLRRTYTDADHTLYADVPELVPTHGLPANHHYLGPVEWSPTIEAPPWWDEVPGDRPVIYATLGSSGRPGLLASVLEALGDLPVSVIAATAGKVIRGRTPSNARVVPYLPGREAAARSSLVIGNGGSPTTHQALGVGTPVLGLAENLDQHLNMRAIVERGAGLLVRSEHARPLAIRSAVERLMGESSFRSVANNLAKTFARYDAHARFQAVLDEVIASGLSRG
jgi:UDP:flavonoid glycosyltransferase YjiC (YdhE family)